MRLMISLPIASRSLNKLLRNHYRNRKKLRQSYQWELIAAGANDPQYQVNGAKKRHIEIKSFRARLLDSDNFIGGLKPFIDALKEMRLIHDDSPEYLELEGKQLKAAKADQRLEIVIEDAT